MSNFNLGFAIGSLAVAILVIIWSPFYRAIIFECLFHPRSNGWIDYDEDGSIYVHRGETLPDYMLNGALKDLEEIRQTVEQDESKASQASSASLDSGNRWAVTKAAAAGIGFLSAYLLRRKNGSSGSED